MRRKANPAVLRLLLLLLLLLLMPLLLLLPCSASRSGPAVVEPRQGAAFLLRSSSHRRPRERPFLFLPPRLQEHGRTVIDASDAGDGVGEGRSSRQG